MISVVFQGGQWCKVLHPPGSTPPRVLKLTCHLRLFNVCSAHSLGHSTWRLAPGHTHKETQTSSKVKTRVHLIGQTEGVCGEKKARLVGRVGYALKRHSDLLRLQLGLFKISAQSLKVFGGN